MISVGPKDWNNSCEIQDALVVHLHFVQNTMRTVFPDESWYCALGHESVLVGGETI